MEHHANLVNWIFLSQQIGFSIQYIPIHPQTLELDISCLENMLTSQVKLISITHLSNSLGVINPIEQIIDKAHLPRFSACIWQRFRHAF